VHSRSLYREVSPLNVKIPQKLPSLTTNASQRVLLAQTDLTVKLDSSKSLSRYTGRSLQCAQVAVATSSVFIVTYSEVGLCAESVVSSGSDRERQARGPFAA